MTATAVATSFQSQDPQFLKTDPQFLKSAETPEKQPILGGKNCSWSLKKIFQSGNGCAMCFLQKKWKNSVKFGLSSRSNISLPRIGGYHPVPSLSILSTERLGTAMYYPEGTSDYQSSCVTLNPRRSSAGFWHQCNPLVLGSPLQWRWQ